MVLMPKRKTSGDDNKLKQGRGQGHGENYHPFNTVRDANSSSRCHRYKGHKSKRLHHLQSDIDRNYFFILEWSNTVLDIREQFPLELTETLSIADRLKIKHPIDSMTNMPGVMTTSFLIDVLSEGQSIQKARSLTSSRQLGSPRLIALKEIERTYWTERGVDWGIVTELDIPIVLTKNISWIYKALKPESVPSLTAGSLSQIETALFAEIKCNPGKPLAHAALAVDGRLGLEAGSSLFIVKHLIATRQWKVDMCKEISTAQPLIFIRESENQEETA